MSQTGRTPRDHISVSQINLYLLCPRKYSFSYIEKLERLFKPIGFAFGGAIHSSIEWFNRERKSGRKPTVQELLRIFLADWDSQKVETLLLKGVNDEADLARQGKELLSLYYEQASMRKPPQSVEMPFKVDLLDLETGEALDLPLEGAIDLVEAGDTVVETKTTSRGFSPIQLAQHLQLSAYGYAYERLFRRKPNLVLESLVKGKKPRLERTVVSRTKQDYVRFFHIAKGVTKAIRSGAFHPIPGWQCADCEFFEACQKWRT